MPYPEALVAPMRAELTRLGVNELRSADEVDALFDAPEGTTLAIVNSVCGCAAANARPAVALASQAPIAQPDRMVTVFAGQDLDATARLREHLAGIPPSSPSIFLLVDGDPVFAVERRHIEGRSASAIAQDLAQAFQKFCTAGSEGDGATERPDVADAPSQRGDLPSTFKSIL